MAGVVPKALKNNPIDTAPKNVAAMILKLTIPLNIKNIAPIKIAILDVSPMLPGIVPTNISVRLGRSLTVPPLKMVPSGVAPL